MAVEILDTLRTCADIVAERVRTGEHLGYSGARESQYHLDVIADDAAVEFLVGAGFQVVSEESGVSGDGEFTVVIDPIDGSTNCDHGIPFFATSLAVVRGDELIAGLVRNLATGSTYVAEVGAGADRDGEAIRVAPTQSLKEAVVSFSGLPDRHLGWAQYRALGASSLEVCLVADGSLDLFTMAARAAIHPWDYLAGLLILRESGGYARELDDRPLVTTERSHRRPIFAANEALANSYLERLSI